MKLNKLKFVAVAVSCLTLGGCTAVPLLMDGASFGGMGNAAMTKDAASDFTANAPRADVFNAALTGLSSLGEIKSSDRAAGVIQGEFDTHKVSINLSDLPGNKTRVSVTLKYAGLMKFAADSTEVVLAKLIEAINKQNPAVVLGKAGS